MHVNICTRDAAGEFVPVERIGVPSTSFADVIARINELSGRTVGSYAVLWANANRRRGRREVAYVAANRGSLWREQYGRDGFVIEVVR